LKNTPLNVVDVDEFEGGREKKREKLRV